MRTLTALILMMASPALAADGDPALLEQAKRQRTTGWVTLGGSTAAVGGGLALMLAGRPSGELSEEDPAVHELRTMGGVGLALAGVTGWLVGADSLRKASVTRERAMLTLAPEPVARGGGIRISGRF